MPGGPIVAHDLSTSRLLIVADALRKNLALARDEREVSKVFEVTELSSLVAGDHHQTGARCCAPSARPCSCITASRVASKSKRSRTYFGIIRNSKRLHARLVDEYELKERAAMLAQKLRVIEETARALTDIIDTERSVRLEATIIILMVVEILVAFYEVFVRAV